MRRFLRGLLLVAAIGYPLAILALTLLIAFVGEAWWPATVAMYLPHALFATPLPVLLVALLRLGPRWLAVPQLGAAALILFPLMGLSCGGATAPAAGPTLRVLSYNVDYGFISKPELLAEIADARADVVVLEAANARLIEAVKGLLAEHRSESYGQFLVASRWPIVEFYRPPPLADEVDPAFVRATLETPLGRVDLYVTHPVSPHRGFDAIRGSGLGQALGSGEVFTSERAAKLIRNSEIRIRQVTALAESARGAINPVIIAGDTNLPPLSPLFRRELGSYRDGWSAARNGFGYTFPNHKWMPWLRLDRVLTGPELRFVGFSVGTRRGSTHRCVIADLTRS
jgi:endonuclease/exonuclease/phosphatase (EEP) superfamily protein YafD